VAPDGALRASNWALFGGGPLGVWRVAIEGEWRRRDSGGGGDAATVDVSFDAFSTQIVGIFGLRFPGAVLRLPLPATGRSAEWNTPFVDGQWRVGRGRTGNSFLFKRLPGG
jgi:hypothetical protein